jgi:hypothetical protein
MIEESFLKHLAPERQAKIRAQIDDLGRRGRPAEFLDLDTSVDTVIYDPFRHADAIELAEDPRILPLLCRTEGATVEELKRVLGYDARHIRGIIAVLQEELREDGQEICAVQRSWPADKHARFEVYEVAWRCTPSTNAKTMLAP